MIYQFDATNYMSQSINKNTASVSLSTFEEAEVARKKLIELGFECTQVICEGVKTFENADKAVEWTKRLFR